MEQTTESEDSRPANQPPATKLSTVETQFPIERRLELCAECLNATIAVANKWVSLAATAKGISSNSAARAEDILSGPTVVARQLQLSMQTLRRIARGEIPELPGRTTRLPNGQLAVRVFPTNGLFDSLTFMGLRASVRLQTDADEDNLHGSLVDVIRQEKSVGISAVLGAGNVSSIPATDSLNRILFEGRKVALKLNPVNQYLAPVFQEAFAPLINAGMLEIITGGAKIGHRLIHNPHVSDVHITGSQQTHDAIVWGTDGQQDERRKQNAPILKKRVTSELGNVTPWIIVPGNYSTRQLHSQAQHIASSITNNASFNCLATKVIVTWEGWNQRTVFLQLLQHYLDQTPARSAYYPGAIERFQRFSGESIVLGDNNELPWKLLVNQRIEERPELFTEESFVCVCSETQLAAKSAKEFLLEAVEFCNHRMSGTLCSSITLPKGFKKRHFDVFEDAVSRLRYGSVCINQWSGLAYGLISPPWGAYPGSTIGDVQSGIGSVHNTYLLDRCEKTVLEGPLINFPCPVWFSGHRNAVNVANRLLQLYHHPSLLKLPRLFLAALNG